MSAGSCRWRGSLESIGATSRFRFATAIEGLPWPTAAGNCVAHIRHACDPFRVVLVPAIPFSWAVEGPCHALECVVSAQLSFQMLRPRQQQEILPWTVSSQVVSHCFGPGKDTSWASKVRGDMIHLPKSSCGDSTSRRYQMSRKIPSRFWRQYWGLLVSLHR